MRSNNVTKWEFEVSEFVCALNKTNSPYFSHTTKFKDFNAALKYCYERGKAFNNGTIKSFYGHNYITPAELDSSEKQSAFSVDLSFCFTMHNEFYDHPHFPDEKMFIDDKITIIGEGEEGTVEAINEMIELLGDEIYDILPKEIINEFKS